MRLDLILVEKGLVKSRSRAQKIIESGNVKVAGNVISKSSFDYVDGDIEILDDSVKYVSRGGLKLEKALIEFKVDVTNMTACDIGASTGGFTDCLLQNGASHVFAIDSGYNQLDEKLLKDNRVTNIEHYNARNLAFEDLGKKCNIAVADLSFISSTYIIPRLKLILEENGIYVGLIKPQFECGPAALNKNGIVKDKKQHFIACKKVIESLSENGFSIYNLVSSPILGGDGNKEFLVYAVLDNKASIINDLFIRKVVEL